MDIKPIRSDEDLDRALEEIESLVDAKADSDDEDRLIVLSTLVEAYEDEHYYIPDPDPIEAIDHAMEALGLGRSALEPILGSRARVSEILNRRRPLSLAMIRRLEEYLEIPAEVLIQPYELAEASAMDDDALWITDPAQYYAMHERPTMDSDSLPSGTVVQRIRSEPREDNSFILIVEEGESHAGHFRAGTRNWMLRKESDFGKIPNIDLFSFSLNQLYPVKEPVLDDSTTEDADKSEVNR